MTLARSQTHSASMTLAPSQTHSTGMTLAPSQTQSASMTLAPSQTHSVSMTLAPSQTHSTGMTLAPRQTHSGDMATMMWGAVCLSGVRTNRPATKASRRPELPCCCRLTLEGQQQELAERQELLDGALATQRDASRWGLCYDRIAPGTNVRAGIAPDKGRRWQSWRFISSPCKYLLSLWRPAFTPWRGC